MEKEVALTGKGVILLTFLSKNEEGRKIKLYKSLFIQRAVRNGLTLPAFHEYTGVAMLAAVTPQAQIMACHGKQSVFRLMI